MLKQIIFLVTITMLISINAFSYSEIGQDTQKVVEARLFPQVKSYACNQAKTKAFKQAEEVCKKKGTISEVYELGECQTEQVGTSLSNAKITANFEIFFDCAR